MIMAGDRPESGQSSVLGREKEKEITTGADRLELKDDRRGHGGGQKGCGGGRVRNLVVRFMTLREDMAGGMGGARAVG
jgi:hypothetical protein